MKTNRITIGILAHVDAGKTTLSESILYKTGQISRLGRVDHQDAFLDTYDLEKTRGITIFSKQAVFPLQDYRVTLLDTPGHVDFSTEMERTLRVLDYAILVINGVDGIQGHTLTVWKLLKRYHIPTFVFVNKMDLLGANRENILKELKNRIHENCIDFSQSDHESLWDELALCDEQLMEKYLDTGALDREDIQLTIGRRHAFPVYFGSALKLDGVEAFIDGLSLYIKPKAYPDIFGARVFKVIRNDQGERLTYMKITGDFLKVKTLLSNSHQMDHGRLGQGESGDWQEKVNQIRLYSGAGYELVNEVGPGTICAVTGLTKTRPGDGLGFEPNGDEALLTPVLNYRVLLPEDSDAYTMLKNLRLLEEEDPYLNILWHEKLSEIHIQVMGEIQLEILKSRILERFGVSVTFDKGNLLYKETIESAVIGRGHFEPLKHYSEVHLLLEPLDKGKGMVFGTDCSEDILGKNWQNLVLTHLYERQHIGVLTGSTLTDMKITLVAGRGHNKHTEGGDFRQATFRALRQGLMKTKSVLLEPVYEYRLELPRENLGKAMSDIEKMSGRYREPIIEEDHAILKGTGPVARMMHYGTEVLAYTKGLGRLSLRLKGYEPCHNAEEVIGTIGYNPNEDVGNPADSVFCSKGSGYTVSWEASDGYMHVESDINRYKEVDNSEFANIATKRAAQSRHISEEELEAIFTATYGKKDRQPSGGKLFRPKKRAEYSHNSLRVKKESKEKYLLVDGYNMVFSWDGLKELANENLDTARQRLMDMLCNYQVQKGGTVILVFDAYRVAGNRGNTFKYNNIYVVYTKEAETADQYIERLVDDMGTKYDVTVATSDVLEQVIILGKGAMRLSAEGLFLEMESIKKELEPFYRSTEKGQRHRPFESILDEDK